GGPFELILSRLGNIEQNENRQVAEAKLACFIDARVGRDSAPKLDRGADAGFEVQPFALWLAAQPRCPPDTGRADQLGDALFDNGVFVENSVQNFGWCHSTFEL